MSDAIDLTDAGAFARLLDDLPLSLMVYRLDGMLWAMNQRAEAFWSVGREEIVGRFNVLEDAQSVAQSSRERFAQALAGELILTPPQRYDTSQVAVERRGEKQLWFRARMFALRGPDGAASHVAILHENVTEEVEAAQRMEIAQVQITQQRAAIDALASPIIQVWEGILTVPLVGAIDARRAMSVTEALLEAIVSYQADIVILDITGVPVVDTQVASAMLQTARAVRLLGSQPVLVGVSVEIAQTLVQLGVDLEQIITLANLKAGIAWAFEQQGLQVSVKRKAQSAKLRA